MRTSVWRIGSIAALLLLSSCRKPETAASASASQDPVLQVQAGGYHGHHFSGPVYLPRSSPLDGGTTAYNVAYQPGVTVLSKDDTKRHLVAIRPDGYLFDSTATQIAELQSGGMLLLSGLALATVADVKQTGNGYLVKTGPAKITDAIKDGRLEGSYKVDFGKLRAAEGISDFDVDFAGYNYHVKFTPNKDRLDIQATIKFGSSQGVLAYEGVGYISNFVSNVRMQIKDGQLITLGFSNQNLTGQVELKWFAFAADAMKAGAMAKITSWPAELLKSSPLSRAAYHAPILLGAVPFDLRISLGFSFIPEFTSKNSVIEGSKLVKYGGSGGFLFADSQTKPAGSMQADGSVDIRDIRVVSAGPVGFTAATEAPRVELMMGWPPASPTVAGYLNFIASYGTVTNGRTTPPPCQTNVMAFSVNAGAASSSPNTFADWIPAGGSPAVSLWQRTLKSAGPEGRMCSS